jgi:hypothetical protein
MGRPTKDALMRGEFFPQRHSVKVLDTWIRHKKRHSQIKKGYGKDRNPLITMVGDAGFEPAAPAV